MTTLDLMLNTEKRFGGTLRDFRKLNKMTRTIHNEGQSNSRLERWQPLSVECSVQKGESFKFSI